MNKIEQLIQQYCPDGVEYRELIEIFNLKNGYTPSTNKKEYWENPSIPWFRMEDLRTNGNVLSEAIQSISDVAVKGGRLFPANSILIATSATIGEHALVKVPHLSNQRFTSLSLKSEFNELIDMKFIFYYCFLLCEWCKNNVTTSSFASVDMSGFKKFKFPIPPLAIQQEIVTILDKFTALEAELEAELEARSRQYEYYRNQLLSFEDKEVQWKALGEVVKISNGKDHKHLSEGKIPVYGSGGIMRYANDFIFEKETVLIPRKGSIGNIFYVNEPFWTVDTIFYTKIDFEVIKAKFLYYFLKTQNLAELNFAGGVPSLTKTILDKIKIPIPSLEEQERIVNILDQFDALVNDIKTGLPAEIKARRAQYEYYRKKLLTFNRVN